MVSLPVEVIVGISIGLVLGIVPAASAGLLGFVFEHYVDWSVPQFLAVLIALPFAGGLGYLAEVVTRDVTAVPRFVVASFVVVMLAIYANSQGQKLAHRMPTDLNEASRSKRTLSEEAVDNVDGLGQVTIRPTGDVGSLDGYPPVEPAVETALSETAWRVPADLPLSEIETRLADKLRTEHDLAAVNVAVDARGRATIDAAPQSKDLARRVPDGHRAVSVNALAPASLSAGDEVTVRTDDTGITGSVVSVAATEDAHAERRITVAVSTAESRTLLEADGSVVVAHSHDASREYDAFRHMKRDGATVRAVTLDDALVDAIDDEDADVSALAVQSQDDPTDEGWTFDPATDALAAGADAFVVGDTASISGGDTVEDAVPIDGGAA